MTLDDLIVKLNHILTLTSNVSIASDTLRDYNSDDWTKYIIDTRRQVCYEGTNNTTESHTNYTKNLIYRNNIYEIFLISWDEGAMTSLHNHPENGCILKILDGLLIETRQTPLDEKILNVGDISHINHNTYHKIKSIEKTYSLHIYSPPMFYS